MNADHLAGLVSGVDERAGASVHGLTQRPPARHAPLAVHVRALRRPIAEQRDTLADPAHEVALRHQGHTLRTSGTRIPAGSDSATAPQPPCGA